MITVTVMPSHRIPGRLAAPPPMLRKGTGAVMTTAEDAADVRRPLKFFRPSAAHETWMFMSGIIALCGLVVVAAVILPVFGPRVAAVAGVAVVTAIVLLCYLVCIPRAFARTILRDFQGGSDRDH